MKTGPGTLILAVTFAVASAAADERSPQPPASTLACFETQTVFQDVSFLGRKNRGAANITERHEEMARDRWRFVDLAVYTENSDIEGFFLTYERPAPCPTEAND